VSIDAVIEQSVETLARNVRERRAYFLFMFRERMSGITSVRGAIRHELELFERELATDLARLPGPDGWSTEDLRVFANLIVGLMVNTTEAILTAPRAEAERAAVATAEKQIRFLVIGAASWQGQAEVQVT
jgi:hypothetical protein